MALQHRRPLLILAAILALAAAGPSVVVRAQQEGPAGAERGERSLITVTGEAEVRVVPDEFVLGLGVETRGPDLAQATRANDAVVARLIAMAKERGVADRLIQTDYMAVRVIYPYQNDQADALVAKGFAVQRTVNVTLTDGRQVSDLRIAALSLGANQLYGVQMRTTAMRKHRDDARVMAVRAAREKAILIARELGRTVGRAHRIEVDASQPQGSWRSSPIQNAIAVADGDEAGSADFAPGQITVTSRVRVEFELD